MTVNFDIFQKQKKITLTENLIVYCSLTIFFLLAWLFSKTDLETVENIFKGLAISTLLLGIYFKINQHTKYEKLNGKLIGKIEFYKDRIKVIDREIFLDQISKLDFEFNDYEGNYRPPMRGDFNPALSNGVDNSIKIDLLTKEKIHLNVKINYEGQPKQLREYLVEYMKTDKISAYKVATVLGLRNYQEIQEFKENTTTNSGLP
jgi:hypothetical protein